jgi:hypothetical protein
VIGLFAASVLGAVLSEEARPRPELVLRQHLLEIIEIYEDAIARGHVRDLVPLLHGLCEEYAARGVPLPPTLSPHQSRSPGDLTDEKLTLFSLKALFLRDFASPRGAFRWEDVDADKGITFREGAKGLLYDSTDNPAQRGRWRIGGFWRASRIDRHGIRINGPLGPETPIVKCNKEHAEYLSLRAVCGATATLGEVFEFATEIRDLGIPRTE